MRVVGCTSGAVLPCALADLLPDAFAGLMVKDVPARKALVFVKGLERTTMLKLGEQRKMTTAVKCIYADGASANVDRKYTLVAYCHENYVSDFKFDMGQAVAVVTNIHEAAPGKNEFEVVVENVSVCILDDVIGMRAGLHAQAKMATVFDVEAAFAPAPSVEEMSDMQKGQKRCRTIEQYPSDA